MKILFIENRYRTRFWERMSRELQKEGHEIFFLVQNHQFKPSVGQVVVLPYPHHVIGNALSDRDVELVKSDRNINYFCHKGIGHYSYYRQLIYEYLNQLHPNVVFGESTAFHELLTIDLCKELSIPYFQPSTCRFPTRRFSFYCYDTLEPFSGSDEILSDENALRLIEGIVNRSVKPDYMIKSKVNLGSRVRRWGDLMRLSLGYLQGEHYNTPSPWVKSRIERKRNNLICQWDILASTRSLHCDDKCFRILYPMQMQPEANLDVWGRHYRNQLETIRQLIANTPANVVVVVKPNPKSKYELTEDLLSYISSEKRIIPVVHSVQMGDVLPFVDLVVTVTGTIAIECILANKPILTLVKTLNNDFENCLWMSSLDEVSSFVELVISGRFPKIDARRKIDFVNLLNRTSFNGIPYESNLTVENIDNCLLAFRKLLNLLSFKDLSIINCG